MAKTKPYIVQYHMPLGLENPKINIPEPNKPEVFELTEGEVVMLKRIVPDVKCVLANSKEKEDSENTPVSDETSTPDQVDESETEVEETEEEESSEETEDEAETSESGTSLVEDFPGRDDLLKAGLESVEEVLEFSQENNLVDIDGIGKVTSDKITDFIHENYNNLI